MENPQLRRVAFISLNNIQPVITMEIMYTVTDESSNMIQVNLFHYIIATLSMNLATQVNIYAVQLNKPLLSRNNFLKVLKMEASSIKTPGIIFSGPKRPERIANQ